MKGFFEHQYLSYKKNHLKNLLALANADGNIHKKEIELLFKIGKKYGLKDWQIQNLVDAKEVFELNIPDNFHDRMNLLYDLMLMVYADGKVEKREIEFCEDVAKRFSMNKAVVKWLLDKFDRGLPPPPDQWEEMKEHAREKYSIA
ncbi:MAG: TerB family tellurite resistance protein [Cyclobacteriaceae bacterium]|nr:TerB family tellurite resistance protein [Cyclobacteriaceae bacterium]MBX2955135.1 TerB family tellurite resistance protein [Cyclobacteriaceae bacterium]